MATEHIDKPNNDAIPDDSSKQEEIRQHYANLGYKLTDSFLRGTQDPADTSRREQLDALLTNPNIDSKDLRRELASLLQDETFGTTTRKIITDCLAQSYLLNLPNEILWCIIQKLDKKSRVALLSTEFGLFKRFQAEVSDNVVNGNENVAKILLKRETPESPLDSSVLQQKDLTDPGGRTFKDISPLQYAYWMGDWYMVDMLLDNLPKEYLAEAQRQINKVKRCNSEGEADLENQKGIEYQLYLDIDAYVEEKDLAVQHLAPVILPQESVEYHINHLPENYDYTKATPIPEGKRRVLVTVKGEQHYDYQPLIEALKAYVNIHSNWIVDQDDTIREQLPIHWTQKVGGVQAYATTFLAQQYCNPNWSNVNKTFDEKIFMRSLLVAFIGGPRLIPWFLRSWWMTLQSAVAFTSVQGRCITMRGGCSRPRIHQFEDEAPFCASRDIVSLKLLGEVSLKNLTSVEQKHFAGISPAMRLP